LFCSISTFSTFPDSVGVTVRSLFPVTTTLPFRVRRSPFLFYVFVVHSGRSTTVSAFHIRFVTCLPLLFLISSFRSCVPAPFHRFVYHHRFHVHSFVRSFCGSHLRSFCSFFTVAEFRSVLEFYLVSSFRYMGHVLFTVLTAFVRFVLFTVFTVLRCTISFLRFHVCFHVCSGTYVQFHRYWVTFPHVWSLFYTIFVSVRSFLVSFRSPTVCATAFHTISFVLPPPFSPLVLVDFRSYHRSYVLRSFVRLPLRFVSFTVRSLCSLFVGVTL